MRTILSLCLVPAIVFSTLSAQAAEPLTLKGKMEAATVYRGQALVTRVVEIPGPAGLRELVVTELPSAIVPGSLYAESPDGFLDIRSVRYRERPVTQDVREDVRKLDEQIRKLEDTIQSKTRTVEVSKTNWQYLDGLANFIAVTAANQASRKDFNPKPIQEMTQFLFATRDKVIQEQEVRTSQEIRNLKEQLDTVKRQRDTLAGSSAQTVREAVVFVNLNQPKGGSFKLQYLVNNASWIPSYNVRADREHQKVLVEYNASVRQMSGEDWTDVAMTLSTATPSLTAKAPNLEPLTISLTAPPRANAAQQAMPGMMGSGMFTEEKAKLYTKRTELESSRNAAADRPVGGLDQKEFTSALPQQKYDFDLNAVAKGIQVLEMANDLRIDRSAGKPQQPIGDEGVSVTYKLSNRTSLPSRSDQQIIQVANLTLKAEFYKIATPVLTRYIYEEAVVTNDGKQVLLAGPILTYLNGQFVGHGAMPTIAVGEKVTVGFGIDPALRASRELVEKKEEIQGGNRLVDFTYRLTVENFGSTPAEVRLIDRLPITKGNDIKLTLTSSNPKAAPETKKGILTWNVKVPPQSLGEKALVSEYQFRLEYDKQMAITNLAGGK